MALTTKEVEGELVNLTMGRPWYINAKGHSSTWLSEPLLNIAMINSFESK